MNGIVIIEKRRTNMGKCFAFLLLFVCSYKCESYTNYSRNKTVANEATLDTGTG